MTTGFSTKAEAKPPPHPPCGSCQSPIPFQKTGPNIAVGGTAYPSSQNINATVTPNNSSVPSAPFTYNATTQTAQAWLPHAHLQSKIYDQNGNTYVQITMTTQSQYAPNGDSGTFVFDSAGDLVSGDPSALTRLRNEIQEADPIAMSWWSGVWQNVTSWWQQNGNRVLACSVTGAEMASTLIIGAASAGAGAALAIADMASKYSRKEADACLENL